ncbi:MAG: hypothetical protein LQ343_004230 [Gyalolechia ehrenbergii]|nr:MAG: hypothetical protein LQ343_004230 [Gyalolechia ehrenbergii]
MEPPTKRRRLCGTDNPDVELHQRRVHNDKKLKSIFESIFEKYSKDFSDVGDVIDFANDEIVIDNGHIMNMVNEKDLGEEDEWSDDEVDLSPSDVAKTRYPDVVPDSQDLESSDDDPLGLPQFIFRPKVSPISQGSSISLSKTKTGHPQDGKRSMEQQHRAVSSLANRHSSNATWKLDSPLDWQDNSTIEEAWQVPPLPEDENIQAALLSPSPSLQGDSDSARLASPPKISIWAPVANRRRSKALDTRAALWTIDEKELLRHYRTSTDLSFEDICNHFPGRTPNSLRKRWQTLNQNERSIRQNRQRNAWTQEEDQLLHRLKRSTDKTFAEIQSELARHPIGAVQIRWYKIRQMLDHPLQRNDSLPSDPHNLSSPREPLAEDVPCEIDAVGQRSSPKSSCAPAECFPQAGKEETLISLRELESDQSKSCSEDDLGGQKRFPSDMVIPDSQVGEATQHFLNQSLNPKACRRRPFMRPKIQDDNIAMKFTSLPLSNLDSAPSTTKLKAYPMYRQSPQSTLYPLKRKRIADNAENDRQILPKPKVSSRASGDQNILYSGGSHRPALQHISKPISESSFSPEQSPDDTHETSLHCSSLPTSNSHLEYSVPNSSALCNVQPNELMMDSVNGSPPDLTFANAPSRSPAQVETPQKSGKGQSNDPIEISSSPPSQTSPTEPKAQQFMLKIYTETNTTNVVANPASDELSVLGTKDNRDEVVLQSLDLTPEIRCDSRSATSTASDECPSCVGQNLELSTKEQKSSPGSTDSSEAMETSQQHMAQIPPSSENGSPLFEHHPAGNLVSRSGRLGERWMLDVSGYTKPQAMDESSDTPLSTNGIFGEEIITPLYKKVSMEKQVQIAGRTPLRFGSLIGGLVTQQTEQGLGKAGNSSEKLSDVELPSTKIDLPTRGYRRVGKPIEKAVKASTEAEATPCQRFYRVEIPKPSSLDSISSGAAPLIQEHFVVEHELHPTSLPSEDEAHAWKGQGSIHQEGLEQSDFPEVETDEEHRYNGQQNHPPSTAPDLLGPIIEPKAAEDIKEPLTATQSSGCRPQGWISRGNYDLTVHNCPPDVSSSNQEQDMVNEDDEDDLHLFLKPAITLGTGKHAQQIRNGIAPGLALRPRIDDADMSDDELSTPVKATQKQIEMTPVRSLLANR